MEFNGEKTREWKDGRSEADGTRALGSLFNAEFNRLYDNVNWLKKEIEARTSALQTTTVHLSGNQTIEGEKTFTILPKVPQNYPPDDAQAASFAAVRTLLKRQLVGQIVTAFSETEANALGTSGCLELIGSIVNVSQYPILAARRPQWVNGSQIILPNLSNRVLRIKGQDTAPAGGTLEDAAPEIWGNFLATHTGWNPNAFTGSFLVFEHDHGGIGHAKRAAASWTRLVDFHASRCNGVFGRAGEVRSKSFIVRMFVATDYISLY